MPFELHTGNRKLNYTSEYAYGKFCKYGKMITFEIMWKGRINESGENAFIKAPLLCENTGVIDASVTVGDRSYALDGNPATVHGILRAAGGLIGLYENNGFICKWNSATSTQYLKISGTYLCE